MSETTSIHIWVPGIREGAGGIQAFSRVYVQAIREAYPSAKICVFVKNDEPLPDDPLRRMGIAFHSVAKMRPLWQTMMLIFLGIAAGLKDKPACAVTTHLHFLPALLLLKWLRGVPVMSVLHGMEAWDLKFGLRVLAMKNADHLMAVSQHTRQVVISSYDIAPWRVSVVPNTFDTERFKPGPKPAHLLRRYGLMPEQPVILSVSRLALSERYKGHRQVLTALETVRQSFPNACYMIVGSGDDLPALRELVMSRGLQDHVIMTGQVPGDELADHYRLCDAFVMPSTKEGFGIVFLEAMGCGKPVVAGNVDGSVDALDGGRLGRLVDPNNLTELGSAICDALAHRPRNALWNNPELLQNSVAAQFGYSRISRLLADDLAVLMGDGTRLQAALPLPTARMESAVPSIVVLTQLTSPYQVEFFDAVSAAGMFRLKIVYLTTQDPARQWSMPHISHDHIILSEGIRAWRDAWHAVSEADLVVFNYYTNWFALAAIRQRAHVKRPWVFWGERPGFLKTGPLGVLGRLFLLKPLHRQTVPIWAVGQFGLEGYQREFGQGRRYENIPYFSNLERYLEIPRSPADARVFLYSGTLTHRKGVDLLATAFVRVAARHPHARLVLLGSGEMEDLTRKSFKPCVDQVTWLGFQKWEKLPESYAKGSVFCFPSRYDGWGLALVEALAGGMPAIGTTRTGSAVEFLADGKSGWLIEADSADALEQAMEAALELSAEDFGRMQIAARVSVAQNGLGEGVARFTDAARHVLEHWSV